MSLPMPELISCMADDRGPTGDELLDVAGRIWIESGSERSALAWGRLAPNCDERSIAIRLALVALRGSHLV